MNALKNIHRTPVESQAFVLPDHHLTPDEKAVFLAAARVIEASASRSGDLPASIVQKLWLCTGRASQAPSTMPEQPMAPGLLGWWWRRLRAAITSAATDDSP